MSEKSIIEVALDRWKSERKAAGTLDGIFKLFKSEPLSELGNARSKAMKSAYWRVKDAIASGKLAKLPDGTLCADCGNVASVWDPREYAKPLDVTAVCQRCNVQRGPAVDSWCL